MERSKGIYYPFDTNRKIREYTICPREMRDSQITGILTKHLRLMKRNPVSIALYNGVSQEPTRVFTIRNYHGSLQSGWNGFLTTFADLNQCAKTSSQITISKDRRKRSKPKPLELQGNIYSATTLRRKPSLPENERKQLFASIAKFLQQK